MFTRLYTRSSLIAPPVLIGSGVKAVMRWRESRSADYFVCLTQHIVVPNR